MGTIYKGFIAWSHGVQEYFMMIIFCSIYFHRICSSSVNTSNFNTYNMVGQSSSLTESLFECITMIKIRTNIY